MNKLSVLGLILAVSLAMFATTSDAAKFNLNKAAPAKSDSYVLCTADCFPPPPANPTLADCPGPRLCAVVPTGQQPVFCTTNNTCPTGRPVAVCLGPCPVEPPVVQYPLLPKLPPAVRRTAAANGKYEACGDQLAQLRRVTVGQVRRIGGGAAVHLVPLCDTTRRSLTEQQVTYLARGNVQGLTPAIDGNDTLMAELEDNGYEANDVVGIALAPGAAVLYVSRH